MNVPKLLRTALLSVFSLLLVGGLTATHAQEPTVVVTPGAFDNLEQALAELDGQVDPAEGAGTLAIEANDYRDVTSGQGNPAVFELDEPEGNAIQNIESLTIEAREGAQNAVIIGRIEYDPDGAGTDLNVTVQSEGGAFVRLTGTDQNGNDLGQPALALGGAPTFAVGTFTVDSAGDVELDGGTTLRRFAGVELAGDIQYGGRPSLQYTTDDGSPISESGELPDNGNLSSLSVGGDGTVTFSDVVTAINPGFSISDNATANFNSDLTVSTGVFSAGTGQTVDVEGTLALGEADAGIVTVDGELEAGSIDATYSGNGGFDGSGTFTVESTLAAILDIPDGASTPFFANVIVDPSGTASFNTGTVEDDAQFDDDDNFQGATDVRLDADDLTDPGQPGQPGGVGTLTASGAFGAPPGTPAVSSTGAGTVTLLDAEIFRGVDVSGSGKVNIGTSSTPATVSVEDGGTFDNAGRGIEISEGSELLVDIDGGITVQNGGSGITGDGTLAFDDQNTDGATSYTVSGNPNDPNILPNLEVAAGNGVEVQAGGGTTQDGFSTVTDSVTASEALEFSGAGNVSTGGVAANAAVDFSGGGDVSAGNVTANEAITFGSNVGAVSAGDVTADADISFDNGGSIDLGALTVTSGETAVAASAGTVTLLDFQIENTGTFDITDANVEVERNFTRTDGADVTVSTNGSTSLQFTGAEDATIDLGDTRFLFEQGDIFVSKDQAADASVVVDGILRLASNAALVLEEPTNQLAQTTLEFTQNLNVQQSSIFLSAGAGDFQVDTGDNTVVFRGSGNAIRAIGGQGSLDITNIQNRASDDLVVGGFGNAFTLTVTEAIDLNTDGISIDDNAVLNPAPGAEVVRNVGNGGTEISESNGTFNDAENVYDLTYNGSGAADTDAELNDFVGDLTVEGGATARLDDSYQIGDTLSVAGRISEDGNSARTLTLTADSAEHSVTGRIEGGGNAVTLQVDGTGAVVAGTNNPQLNQVPNVAVVENFVANDEGVVVENLHEIGGTLDVSADITTPDTTITPSLTLGLADDQAVGGALTAANALTLASSVTTGGDVDVNVDPSTGDAADGSIAFGEYNLTLTGNFTGEAGASYTADGGGDLVFGDDGSFQNFSTANEAIPNVTVFNDGGGSGIDVRDLNNAQDTSAVSNSLTVQAPIDLNGQALEFEGQTVLSANITDSSPNAAGVFRAVGSDVIVSGGNQSIQNFTVDAGSDTVSVLSATPQTNTRTLSVPGTFALNSGTVAHGQNTLSIGSNFVVGSDFGSESDGILGGPGYFAFNGTTTALAANVSIDRLQVLGNSSLASGSEGEITVGDELWLNADLSTSGADNGSLAIADGATIRRTQNSGPNSLDETPSFVGAVNLAYDDTLGVFIGTSGREVPSADGPGTIGSVTADTDSTLTFSPVRGPAGNVVAATGNVIVEDEFTLETGSLRYGFGGNRQLELAEGARFVRVDGQIPAQVTTPGGDQFDIPSITASDYTLVYRPEGDTLVTSPREFLGDASIDLSVTQRLNRNGNPIGNGGVRLHADRTVDSLFVDRTNGNFRLGVFDQNNNLVPSTLTVDGETVVDGGTVNSGTLQAQGDFVGSGGTVNSSLLASADVTTEAPTPTSFGDLRFVGTDVQSFSPATSAGGVPTQADITMNQETDTTDVPRVLVDNTVSVPNSLTLRSGLLVLENQEDEVDIGGTFTRNVADGSASHVVGAVRQSVGQTTRFAYPLGTMEGNYREIVLDYLNDFQSFPQGFNIRIGHVNQTPDGSLGLPATDDTGVTVDKGDRFWRVQPNQSLGVSASVDVEIVSEGLLEGEDAPDENDFRILRRFDGNAQENDYRIQGFGSQYDNILRGDGSLRIRAPNSTGSLASEGAIFTVGVPVDVQDGFSIAGSVSYPTVSDGSLTGGRSLSGVPVEASSADTTVTDTTDADGNYRIAGLPAGDYDVTPTVSDSVENVSTADALRAVRGFAGLDPFAGPFQEQVADVNGSGNVNATDALLIAQLVLGNVDGFDVGSFVTESESVALQGESATGVSLFAAEAGDVRLTGGQSESSGAALASSTISPTAGAGAAATQSSGSASSVGAEAGKVFEVPVQIDRSATVGAYQMTLDFPADKASFEGIEGTAQNVLTNASDGTVKVSWFDQSGKSALDLRDGSDLVTLRFKAAADVNGARFAPEVTSGEIVGADATPLSAGVEVQAVNISAPTPDKFALNGSYPNPVRGQATIDMDLPSRTDVTIGVYNVLGQRVQTMKQTLSAGAGQTIQLDGSTLSSGQYFYRVKASFEGETVRKTGRITVVK